jgi:hypothetical protein
MVRSTSVDFGRNECLVIRACASDYATLLSLTEVPALCAECHRFSPTSVQLAEEPGWRCQTGLVSSLRREFIARKHALLVAFVKALA